jgi:hypothetical protein
MLCVGFLGMAAARADETAKPEAATAEQVAIAKVAVDWWIFDDWVHPKPKGVGPDKVLTEGRKIWQNAKTTVFPVGIMGEKERIDFGFAYDRTTRALAPQKLDPVPTPDVICLTITMGAKRWIVRIDMGNRWVTIGVKQEGETYYVYAANEAWIVD